jgi:hypothetical protein
MKSKYLISIALITMIAGCASGPTPNVVPMAGGTYRTTGFGESENDAQSAALKSANSTCGKSGGQLTVSTEQTKYKGVVSETSNRNLNKLSSLAENFGALIPTLGGNDDYEVMMTFVCKS